MPNYSYKAVDRSGRVVKGMAVALDETDVELKLSHAGLALIQSRSVQENILSRWSSASIKLRTVVEFYHRLAQTLEIGLPLLSALEENNRYLPSKPMRRISGEIKAAVEGGRTLFEAMGAHGRIFSKLDLAIVRMGEQTGVLPACLKQLAAFLQWKEELRAHIRKATIYPAFVVVSIVAVLAVWIGYVLPQMVKVLAEMQVVIPAATLLVLQVSDFAKAHWLWFCLSGGVAAGSMYLYQRTDNGGIRFDRWLLKIPLLGMVLRNIALARLCHNFATMFGAGMAIQQIFSTLSDSGLGNRHLENRLKIVYKEIESGEGIATAFEAAGGYPSLLLGAIRNGEATGTLDQSFQRLGDYFDAEVKRTVQALLSAIEPMAIIALGAIFGLIVLSILLPLYDVMGAMGKAY
ncbi:type II secretion system F family protein [Desulfatitalea tepidiphila]|uniref:type II secretion system F family protein n=1 Tax=Desulfatitalea tepidiphila TaxID=1185843 RepID=UPI0006B427AA|nr:type II secretion system F family protein [Desulfatitalea tepidiphila]